jgi:ribonuclease HI
MYTDASIRKLTAGMGVFMPANMGMLTARATGWPDSNRVEIGAILVAMVLARGSPAIIHTDSDAAIHFLGRRSKSKKYTTLVGVAHALSQSECKIVRVQGRDNAHNLMAHNLSRRTESDSPCILLPDDDLECGEYTSSFQLLAENFRTRVLGAFPAL